MNMQNCDFTYALQLRLIWLCRGFTLFLHSIGRGANQTLDANKMTDLDIKRKMKALWRETFTHDSNEYVDLVFNQYFDPGMVEYEEQDGDIVAAMLAVPYRFGNADHQVEALYLCGLATRDKYRGRGIMTRLLDRINQRAAKMGYAFTFLIPANRGMQLWYRDRGYVNAFYRVIDNYTSVHDFDLEYESVLAEQKEKVAELKRRQYAGYRTGKITTSEQDPNAIEGITQLIERVESAQSDLRIIHSRKDIAAIIRDNNIDGGAIHYVLNAQGEVTAAAFCTIADRSEVRVHKIYASDTGSRYKVLGAVKNANSEIPMAVYVSTVDMDRKALWSRTYGSVMPESQQAATISTAERVYSLAAHAKVYGMARILNLDEILKFMATDRRALKYSILVREGQESPIKNYRIKDGELKVTEIGESSLSERQESEIMTIRDIAEVILRRRDGDSLITEAFGIPSINASISLMLD